MLRWLTAAIVFFGLCATGADAQQRDDSAVGVGPAPSSTPISWEIDFKYVPPRRIAVKLASSNTPAVYWYMLYTATNTSRTTQHFYPTFELVTDDLRVIETDIGISPLVFNAIRERHKITHNYLVSPSKAIGDLNAGRDYARESVAIWRADDLNIDKFCIYIAGLSGEARAVPNPAFDANKPETVTLRSPTGREREITVNPEYFTLRKTLKLDYALPASARSRGKIDPRLTHAAWIMR